MRLETITMEVPTGAGSSGKFEVTDRFVEKTVQAAGYIDGKWQLEGTLNGTSYDDVEAPIASDGFTIVDGTFLRLRLRCVVAPSGDPPTIIFGGLDSRTD
jgi:hypothetical protein